MKKHSTKLTDYIRPNKSLLKSELLKYLCIDNKKYDKLLNSYPKWKKRWMKSKETDFSAYELPDYLVWNFQTHFQYTQNNFVRTFAAVLDEKVSISSVLDMGAGCGLGTKMLADNLKDLNKIIYCDNSAMQRAFACKVLLKSNKFKIYSNSRDIKGQIDLICAFEFFEHIKNPVDLLKELIQNHNPKYLSVANAFGQSEYGHFSEYMVDGDAVSKSKIPRIFGKYLRNTGWVLLDRCNEPFWNRPKIWKRNRRSEGQLSRV